MKRAATGDRRRSVLAMLGLNATQSLIPALIKFSALGSVALTFGRCAVAAVILLSLSTWRGLRLRDRRTIFATVVCGLLLAAHWVLFIEAVKRTTVLPDRRAQFRFLPAVNAFAGTSPGECRAERPLSS